MSTSPLHQACAHVATPQERDRDPQYLACTAAPGQPCRWATRYDGLADPPFHSERLEDAASQPLADPEDLLDAQAFREAVLGTGLV